jgi:hypothetical protein
MVISFCRRGRACLSLFRELFFEFSELRIDFARGLRFDFSSVTGMVRRWSNCFEDEDEDDWALRAIRGGGRSGHRLGAWLGGRRRR